MEDDTLPTPAEPAARPPQPGLSELGFEILRAAVNLARNYQIKRLVTLEEKLQALYPNHDADIKSALSFWAARERTVGALERD